MPKIKTHSGAKKRFKVTGTGKVKFQHALHMLILQISQMSSYLSLTNNIEV